MNDFFSTILNRLVAVHEYLCRRLCRDRLYNSDMSREIDRLTVELERYKEEMGL